MFILKEELFNVEAKWEAIAKNLKSESPEPEELFVGYYTLSVEFAPGNTVMLPRFLVWVKGKEIGINYNALDSFNQMLFFEEGDDFIKQKIQEFVSSMINMRITKEIKEYNA